MAAIAESTPSCCAQKEATTCETGHCHNQSDLSPTVKKVLKVLEMITLWGLAGYAAYLSPRLFFPFFGGGVMVGAYLGAKKAREALEKRGASIGCSQGFLEQLTGIQLPPPLGLAVNAAIMYCHIDHHKTIFIPIIGFNFGMWVGHFIAVKIVEFQNKGQAVEPSPAVALS